MARGEEPSRIKSLQTAPPRPQTRERHGLQTVTSAPQPLQANRRERRQAASAAGQQRSSPTQKLQCSNKKRKVEALLRDFKAPDLQSRPAEATDIEWPEDWR